MSTQTASQIERVGIAGAGFMGSGIAESAARSGIEVVLYEPEAGALDASRGRIEESVGRALERGKLESEEAEALNARLSWTTDLEELAAATSWSRPSWRRSRSRPTCSHASTGSSPPTS